MKIIVGLGNPGKKYEGTRHNVGWLVVNELANQTTDGQWLMIKKLKSSIISHRSLIVLAKPTVFMNESGRAVKSLLKHFKIEPANLWIVHDDIDLSLGRIKIQVGGGAAGHHGVESIIKEIGTKDFVRFRLGIGRPTRMLNVKCQMSTHSISSGLSSTLSAQTEGVLSKVEASNILNIQIEEFVLAKFNKEEKPVVDKMVKRVVDAIKFGLEEGIKKAQLCQV